ncbi:porin [Paraburkholderia sartisoli]|uniref:Outer membrane protein (Porin) n=1 Tax=Paraburkholderia sartisoli TaxID=83784 RepID=A0A1H4D1N7_9BURK|nr:porin [Paraburkholderia sartisoli]SEA66501.1 Outer membrane protein (porin) [Paraburkholderia sartisoli]
MKRLLTLSIASTLSMPVFAQSSVTLFGIISDGLNYTSNDGGKHAVQLASGYIQGTRIGMRGTEDLGGGMKATFFLANIFDVNSGKLAQGLIWGRLAYVGLESSHFGSVTMGRQYDSVVDYVAPLTANGNWGGYLLAHPYDNDNTDTSNRANNTLKYKSVTISGFTFGGTYSFSNTPGFADNREQSVGAKYSYGPFTIGAGYLDASKPGNGTMGALTNTDSIFVANHMRTFGGGINYAIGAALLGFTYTRTDLEDPVSSIYVGSLSLASGVPLTYLRYENFELNGLYQFTPAFSVGAQYVYTESSESSAQNDARVHYHTAGVSADYLLSKRTDVNLQGAYMKVGGGTSGTILDRAYVPGSAGVSSNNHQFVIRLGLRHKF